MRTATADIERPVAVLVISILAVLADRDAEFPLHGPLDLVISILAVLADRDVASQ